jgi:hypothetical protein
MSLQLQQAFGLRREESIKCQPAYADRGDRLVLKASWAKGKKAREIPVRTPEQRAVLDRAHRLAGKGSLIPADRTYIQQLKIYERQTARAGLHKLHGLRHAYTQARYQELTGWLAPAVGGPARTALTRPQQAQDRAVRLLISRELGHALRTRGSGTAPRGDASVGGRGHDTRSGDTLCPMGGSCHLALCRRTA